MDNNSNIDDLFRSEIESFRIEPSESSWNSIQSALAKKRSAAIRKRRLGWFSASVFLLILSYISYKYFSSESSTDNTTKKNIEINTEDSNLDKSSFNSPTPINNKTVHNSSESIVSKDAAENIPNVTRPSTIANQETAPAKLPTSSQTVSNATSQITPDNKIAAPSKSVKSVSKTPNSKASIASTTKNIVVKSATVVKNNAIKTTIKSQYENITEKVSNTKPTLVKKDRKSVV